MANPDVSALAAYLGTYNKQLILKMYKELTLAADGVQVLTNIKNKQKLTKLSIGRGLKPYTGTFASEDGQINYTEREIVLELIQRDMLIDPLKYKDTWMADELAKSLATNVGKKEQIPFASVVFDAINKENAEEMVMALYHGKGKAAFASYASGTTYALGALVKTGSPVKYYRSLANSNTGNAVTDTTKWERVDYLACFEGFSKKIAYAISDEGLSAVSTGAIAAGDSIDQFKSVYKGLSETVRNAGNVMLYCSQNNYEILLADIDEKYKSFTQTEAVTYLPQSNKKAIIKPVNWLSGSGRVIATPANNLVFGTDQLGDSTSMFFKEDHYFLEMSLRFGGATQIRDLEVLAVNDQA